ncbi:hypothetical protein ACTXT7_005473 [Hymenolepis weldensis]
MNAYHRPTSSTASWRKKDFISYLSLNPYLSPSSAINKIYKKNQIRTDFKHLRSKRRHKSEANFYQS